MLDRQVNLVHVPHRWWEGDQRNRGVRQLRVAGGVDPESIIQGCEFYRGVGIPFVEVEPIEVAEMSKIAENSYRYVQIAFAEELCRICSRTGIDFNLLRSACNSKWNIDIPEALDGIGGTCLPKDIRYLMATAPQRELETDLLLSAIRTDRHYATQLAKPLVYVRS